MSSDGTGELAVTGPPHAARRPQRLETHGDERVDDWYWLRDRDNPEVIDHLRAENTHTDAATAHLTELRQRIFEEIRSRVQETDDSAPVPHGDWEYYRRTEEGRQYAIHCRRPRGLQGGEQVLLDENAMAAGHEFFDLRALEVSPDHSLVAYAINTDGSDVADIRIRDLTTGTDLDDVVAGVSENVVWADARTLLYVARDHALRPHQVWRHALGTGQGDDALVYEEPDERFRVSVQRSRDGSLLTVHVASSTSSEAWLLDPTDPAAAPRLVTPRVPDVLYRVTAQAGELVILTNWEAESFRVMTAPLAEPGRAQWTELVAHDPNVRIRALHPLARHLVMEVRAGGVPGLHVLDRTTGERWAIAPDEELGALVAGDNREAGTTVFRYRYTSLVTPETHYDLDLATGERQMVKRQPVPDYDPSRYRTFRLWATAPDGTQVPMSVLAPAGAEPGGRGEGGEGGGHPCLVYGYGSYEISIDPAFSPLRLPLVDRGVIYVIAHPRGGGELGRRWYEDGKFLRKRNTFTDFIACADHLVAEGWTSPDRLVALGRSAGGLLMGAVLNQRPDLFRAVAAEVPFVDVVTTMLDETIPLTVPEFEEWGNPKDPEYYAYMKSYSPYDNVGAAAYPPVLATTGLNDTRVAYWEPAKWVQRLRERSTSGQPVLLKAELGAGHAGPSGRYERWRDEAFTLAWLLDQLGLATLSPPS